MRTLRRRATGERGLSVDEWVKYLGHSYPLGLQSTWVDHSKESPPNDLGGYSRLALACPPAFAAQLVRANLLSQARFVWRATRDAVKPGNLFGTPALRTLERPWTNATTGELLARMEWHAGLAGSAYVLGQGTRLRVLRPDWVTIMIGSDQDPDEAAYALDGEVIGYAYTPGGPGSKARPVSLAPEAVAHWSPIPDPEATYRGMSWLTPVIREMRGDSLATEHKINFFQNAGTPNMVVKLPAGVKQEALDQFRSKMEEVTAGTANAYKTLYLGGGADVSVVGTDLKQLDFAAVQGAGENRISVASRVPASILGIREGLQGSALNAGNFGQARRVLADSWLHPSLADLCACLEKLAPPVPDRAELWYDPDIPFLREDAKEAADIVATQAQSMRTLIDGGFTADSAAQAVMTGDFSLLEHSGLFSVQLQAAGAQDPPGGV